MPSGDLLITFEDLGIVADGDPNYVDETPKNNLDALNLRLASLAGLSVVIASARTYSVAKSDLFSTVPVPSGVVIRCLPGCVIKWAFDTKKGDNDEGLIVMASGSSWSGGTILNDPQVTDNPPPAVNYTLYNYGSVIRMIGNDITLEDVTIDGYNGQAIITLGDRIRVLNPTIRNPQIDFVPSGTFPDQDKDVKPNGSGIRVYGGSGFRCYGGDVATSGDAALQFSGDSNVIGADIEDGLYQGVRCSSIGGRLLLVGSVRPAIRDVRFVGITGEATGGGECIRIQNNVGNDPHGDPVPRPPNPITRVMLRDIVVSGLVPDPNDPDPLRANGFAIENKLDDSNVTTPISDSGDNIAISDVTVENLTILRPSAAALKITASAPPSKRPIRNVRWTAAW